jgi:orsellinic acid C2-O-methyltransferase
MTPSTDAGQRLAVMLRGHIITQLVAAAARLRIPDHLDGEGLTVSELAERTGIPVPQLGRYLQALQGLGLVTQAAPDRYCGTELSALLRSDTGALYGQALMAGHEYYHAWTQLDHALRTSESGFTRWRGLSLWDHFEQDHTVAASFTRTMQWNTQRALDEILGLYEFPTTGVVADIGAGHGALLAGLLTHIPGLRGIAFEHPAVVEHVYRTVREQDLADRCAVVAGDFRTAVPSGADIYLLKSVVHNWDDAAAVRVLANCRTAMGDRGRLLVIERVVDEGEALETAVHDLTMLVLFGSQDRTIAQYRSLLERAGFTVKGTGRVPRACALSRRYRLDNRRPSHHTEEDRNVHLVIGYKSPVEMALRQAGIPHLTVTETHRLAKADAEAGRDGVIPCGDCADIESVLGALTRHDVHTADIELVWGADELTLVPAAVVALILDRPTQLPLDAALRFRDKRLQKSTVEAAGLPVTRNRVLYRPSDAAEAVRSMKFPAVLKPLSGCATTMTYRVNSEAELTERLTEFFAGYPHPDRYLRAGAALLEEYVTGDELHVDGCVFDGKIATLGVSRYLGNNLEVLRSGGPCGAYLTDPVRQADDYSAIQALASASLKALGLVNGVFHMELFQTGDGFQFSECVARWGGNGVVECFQAKFGLDLFAEHVKALSGHAAGDPVRSSSAYCRTFMGAPPGRVIRAPELSAVLARPGIREATVDVVVGEPTPDMSRSTSIRAGNAIVEAPDEQTLLQRVDDLRRWYFAEVWVEP